MKDNMKEDYKILDKILPWDGKVPFDDWVPSFESRIRRIQLDTFPLQDVKEALWYAIPGFKQRLADTLKPGSLAHTHDTLREYCGRMQMTFTTPKFKMCGSRSSTPGFTRSLNQRRSS